MNINRHTYEEFFLLYIDNELTMQERTAVEVFVEQNPDLRQELQLLQQSILNIDSITFSAKATLLKKENIPAAVQEKLLLLIDEELDKNETANLNDLIAKDETVRNEYEELQQAKLIADKAIVFAEKELLYKYEASRIVGMRWWKMAAAAMLIGAGLWLTISYYQTKPTISSTQTASNISTKKPSGTGIINDPLIKNISQEKEEVAIDLITKDQNNNRNKILARIISAKADGTKQLDNSTQVALVKQAVVTQVIQPTNNLPKPYNERLTNEKPEKNDVAVTTTQQRNTHNVMDNSTNIADGNSIASNAAFIEHTNTTNNITYGFDDDEEAPRKNKVGGFFKKLSRVLQRNTKQTSNSEKSIRVANLSFAIQ